MNITSGYIAYCIGAGAPACGVEVSGAAYRVGEGKCDTPICNYNIPPITYRKNKKESL